ncbi:fatty acid desaturase [Kurthia sibirica]|uniref:Fatty acid desaturase n=1 Tax=Kurthia sibirica TaxID=202750 RepID=A0A2U3AJ88_9BACL|nr:fatty acid desaturase [Kurthia sibirica]PWI24577.1 fatty acid desaturase [Kurthia sibirica]GEK33530.1 fatty acid desaturase [Kurthia sibirica]
MVDKEKTKALHQAVKPFAKSTTSKSVIQMVNTLIPLVLLLVAGYIVAEYTLLGAAVISVVASLFAVRTFIIFHDCTHGSFFKNRKLNAIVGTITGILTLFGYSKWRREHLIHHTSSSNLDKRGIGDIWVMTIDEYREASKMTRLGYRLYRNPIVMFGFGPLYLLLISNRKNRKDAKMDERLNTYFINFVLVAGYGALCYFVGWQSVLVVSGLSMFIAGSLGIWLFFIQHTFEDSYFEWTEEWDYVKAAVEGSSYYHLPKPLQWLTGNIGFHHVHHLAPRVPNYELEDAHMQTPPLQQAPTITIKKSLDSLKYKLYNEETHYFITFRQFNKHFLKTTPNPLIPIKKAV